MRSRRVTLEESIVKLAAEKHGDGFFLDAPADGREHVGYGNGVSLEGADGAVRKGHLDHDCLGS